MPDIRGLKRVCAACGARFYDFNKNPIVCPKCDAEFTGVVKVRTRRGRNVIDEARAKQAAVEVVENEDVDDEDEQDERTTVSLDEAEEDEADDDLLDDEDNPEADLDLDDLDGGDDADDDDLDDLAEDIDIEREKDE